MSYLIPMSNTGMLSQQGMGLPTNTGTPVLANPMQPTAAAPVLQGATGNRRMSVRMPQIPNSQIRMGSEGLMRIGGAGLAANNQGALATLGAMANKYGDLQDYNRAARMEEYQQQVLRANEEAERRRLALKMQQDATKDKEDPEARGEVRAGIAKLQQAKAMLTGKDNLTGLDWGTFVSRTIGKVRGDPEEAQRLFLKELRLDSIMTRVSQTKGAISNAEMALFGSQAPSFNDQESVWMDWIDRQIQMSEILLARLSSGERVDENAPISETMPTIANTMSTTTTTPTITVDPEIQSIVDQYVPNTASN